MPSARRPPSLDAPSATVPFRLGFSVARVACLFAALAAMALPGCPERPRFDFVSGEIGPAGGALSLAGVALVIPAGAVTRPTTFSIRFIGAPPTTAITMLWELEPADLTLLVPARVTLPTTVFSAVTPEPRWSVAGSTTEFEDVPPILGMSRLSVTSERTLLGRVYAEAGAPLPVDAGLRDAPIRDTPPPPDTPFILRDTGPGGVIVTTGTARTPADFSCRGLRTAPPVTGTPAASMVRVAELLDGGARASFFDASDAMGVLGSGSTDSTGLGTVPARAGAWTTLDFDFTSGASDALTIPAQRVHFVTFDAVATTRVEVLSQRTWTAIGNALHGSGGAGAGTLVGVVTDCTGTAVEGASIRIYTPVDELIAGVGDFALGYAAGTMRLPSAGAGHTWRDGTFFAVDALEPSSGAGAVLRVEVWGVLTPGGTEERLGCEEVTSGTAPVLFTVGPQRSDPSPSCIE